MTAKHSTRKTQAPTAHKGGSAKLIRLRYLIVASLIVLAAAGIMISAFKTTVVHAEKWNKKANEELKKEVVILPQRGDILASDGSVLATNLTFYNAYIDFAASRFDDKGFHKNLKALADSLAKYHPRFDAEKWRDTLSAEANRPKDKRLPYSKRRHSFMILRNITFEQKEQLKTFPFFNSSANSNRTGLTTDPHMMRSYPYGDMARRSVGRVGMTKESDEIHGISGLEYALDSLLYGKPGKAKKVPLTHKISNWTDVPPQNGYTITTTIDVAMQDIVENELNAMLTTTEADWGTALLMEVATGDIKAISNLERDKNGNYIEAQNYALLGFEPGSVMKVMSMVVALEDGFAPNLDQLYTVGGGYVFGGGRPIRDTHGPAQLPVRKFLCYSSNVGMTKLVAPHFTKDPNAFRERLRKTGLLDRFNTGIAGERPPYFPPLSIEDGGLVSLGRQTFGYASQIPPLYTCAFYNAIANDGKFVRPRIYSKLSTEKGDSLLPVTYVRRQMCSPQTARTIREMLHDVVYAQGGTARNIANDFVEFAGKTGTAQIAPDRKKAARDAAAQGKNVNDSTVQSKAYNTSHYRLAFCGFFPFDKPKYTCMVLISNPAPQYRGAGYTSGVVFKNIALKMYSRGMFGNASDYHTGESIRGLRPIVFANNDRARIQNLKNMLGAQAVERIQSPSSAKGGVPDVRGLSVRDAVVLLESAGYNVAIQGRGYVESQTPAAGTAARPGSRVGLQLRQLNRRKPTSAAPAQPPAAHADSSKTENKKTT